MDYKQRDTGSKVEENVIDNEKVVRLNRKASE